LELQSQLHVGTCYASYSFGGYQYALPVDASAQVCAFNPKNISRASLPGDWEEFLVLMSDKKFSSKVLWPLCPTDLWCSFLTLASQLGNKTSSDVFDEDGLNVPLSLEALDLLKQLTERVPRQCLNMNPVETLVTLGKGKNHLISPLLFGYNNYCRKDDGQIEFSNALGLKGQHPSSLLGGAGIAVSSKSRNYSEIAGFLRFIMRDEVLSGPYFEAGGQPSLRSSWSSTPLNIDTTGFFSKTIDTVANAYTRPRLPGFSSFQMEAAELMHRSIRGLSGLSMLSVINDLYHQHCNV